MRSVFFFLIVLFVYTLLVLQVAEPVGACVYCLTTCQANCSVEYDQCFLEAHGECISQQCGPGTSNQSACFAAHDETCSLNGTFLCEIEQGSCAGACFSSCS